jgi:hypothetical protein
LRGNSSDVLDLRIGSFEVRNEFVERASRRLQTQAGYVMVPRPVVGTAGSFVTSPGDGRISFLLPDATIRDVLDRLCRAAGLGIWIVAYPPQLTKTPGGFFRTASIYNDSPIEDEGQPTWDILPWGTQIPLGK